MVRRYRRRYYRSKNKYSFQQYISRPLTPTTDSQYFTIISPAEITGKRKAKNFTLTFACNDGTTPGKPIIWALIYVPNGYLPNEINSPQQVIDDFTSFPIYEPAQNVIMCGLFDPSGNGGNQAVRRSRLSRNLNAGDGIAVVYRLTTSSDTTNSFYISSTYSITLN